MVTPLASASIFFAVSHTSTPTSVSRKTPIGIIVERGQAQECSASRFGSHHLIGTMSSFYRAASPTAVLSPHTRRVCAPLQKELLRIALQTVNLRVALARHRWQLGRAHARRAANAVVNEAVLCHVLWNVDIAEIDQHRACHDFLQAMEIERAELLPFSDEHQGIGIFRTGI